MPLKAWSLLTAAVPKTGETKRAAPKKINT
jgi:hypothetical protein